MELSGVSSLSVASTSSQVELLRIDTVTKSSSDPQRIKSSRSRKVAECMLLAFLSLVLLGISLTPTVYFVHPPIDFTPVSNFFENVSSVRNCSVQYPYTGQVCLRELLAQQDTNSSSDLITTCTPAVNQVELEQYLAILFKSGLTISDPSPECDSTFRSFLCNYIFGPCNSSLSGRGECRNVRDSICIKKWMDIEFFFGKLPVCEHLPEQESQVTSESNMSSPSCKESSVNTSTPPNPLNCSEFFFFDASNYLCLPICGWSPYLEVGINTVSFLISVVGLVVFSSINLLSAFTVQRHSNLKFPSIYLVLLTADTLVLGVFQIFSFTSQSSLLCRDHQDQIATILNGNPLYCSFTGTINIYCILQMAVLLISYSVVLLWGTAFPFHYRNAKLNGWTKHVFIATLIISFTFPLSSLLLLIDGYYPSNLILPTCTVRNPNHFYYFVTLHMSLLMWVAASLFVFIIWTIFKNLTLNKITKDRRKFGSAEMAEIKLLAILIYFIVVIVLILAASTYITTASPEFYLHSLLPYFACESLGQDGNRNCQKLLLDVQQPHIHNLTVASALILGFLPLVVFIFSTDFKLYIKKCTRK